MLLVLPEAQAITLQATIGVELTITPEAPRPFGFSLGGTVQVAVPMGGGVPAPVVGPFLGGRWGDPSFRRFVMGMRGGVSWFHWGGTSTHWDMASTEGEVGIAFRRDEGPSLDLGLHANVFALGQIGYDVERDLLLDTWNNGTIHVGAQLPVLPMLVEGRPLRHRGGARLPTVLASPEADRALLEEGRAEYASIPAFLRLAAELRALGAPSDLVNRTRHAAREELGHARACFALAGGALVLDDLDAKPRRFPTPELARRTLGAEGWVDGWHGEGAAARRAAAVRDSARCDRIARVKERIAREERAHAELGRDVARWCGVPEADAVAGGG